MPPLQYQRQALVKVDSDLRSDTISVNEAQLYLTQIFALLVCIRLVLLLGFQTEGICLNSNFSAIWAADKCLWQIWVNPCVSKVDGCLQ